MKKVEWRSRREWRWWEQWATPQGMAELSGFNPPVSSQLPPSPPGVVLPPFFDDDPQPEPNDASMPTHARVMNAREATLARLGMHDLPDVGRANDDKGGRPRRGGAAWKPGICTPDAKSRDARFA